MALGAINPCLGGQRRCGVILHLGNFPRQSFFLATKAIANIFFWTSLGDRTYKSLRFDVSLLPRKEKVLLAWACLSKSKTQRAALQDIVTPLSTLQYLGVHIVQSKPPPLRSFLPGMHCYFANVLLNVPT